MIASEEEDVPVMVEETFSGDYVVVFDPLDGSSNIDAGGWVDAAVWPAGRARVLAAGGRGGVACVC